MKSLTLVVEQRHVDKAEKERTENVRNFYSPKCCPLAQKIKEILPAEYDFRATNTVFIAPKYEDKVGLFLEACENAKHLMGWFDSKGRTRTKPVFPLTVTLTGDVLPELKEARDG